MQSMPKFVLLWTDAAVWALVACGLAYALMVLRTPNLAASWRKVFRDAPALCSSLVLALCLVVTLADSVHYRPALKPAAGSPAGSVAYDTVTHSLLDLSLSRLVASREVTYSRPFDYVSFTTDTVSVNGQLRRVAPRLQHGGAHLSDPEHQWKCDLLARGGMGTARGALFALASALALIGCSSRAAATPASSRPPPASGATRARSPGARRCGRWSSSRC